MDGAFYVADKERRARVISWTEAGALPAPDWSSVVGGSDSAVYGHRACFCAVMLSIMY